MIIFRSLLSFAIYVFIIRLHSLAHLLPYSWSRATHPFLKTTYFCGKKRGKEWPTGYGDEILKIRSLAVTRLRECSARVNCEPTFDFQAYHKAVRSNRGDLRVALAESSKQLAPQSGPRVIQHTTRSNKVIDTEKTLEKKELKADGLIVTEKKRTVEHEEVSDAKTG